MGEAAFYRGVYLQARPAGCRFNTSKAIGVFTYGGRDLQTRHCFNKVHSTVTQKSRNKKMSNTLYWTAPVLSTGHVIFMATFVQDAHTFWINVTSPVLRDLKEPGLPGCFKERTSISPTTHLPVTFSDGTTYKQRHFAHVHPASSYSHASQSACVNGKVIVAITIICNLYFLS